MGLIYKSTFAISIFGLTSFVYFMKGDEQESKNESSDELPYKLRVIGTYENRIREMSNPEKIFEYYASIWSKEDKQWYMSPLDLVRAITPFNFTSSFPLGPGNELDTKKYTFANPSFFREGNDVISIGEYLFYTTILAIPKHMFEVAFKMADAKGNGNGRLDKKEFEILIKQLSQLNPLALAYRNAGGLSQISKTKLKILPALFGQEDGSVSLKEFVGFMEKLHSAIEEIQFSLLDSSNTGKISPRTFGKTLAAYGDIRKIPQLEVRVNGLSDEETINKESYANFYRIIENSEKIGRLAHLLLSAGKPFGKEELKSISKAVAGVTLDDVELHIIFTLFDVDGDGTLSIDEMQSVFRGAKTLGLNKPRDIGIVRFISCLRDCYN